MGLGGRGRMVARGACRGGRMAAQPQPKPTAKRRAQMLSELLEREGSVLRRQARLHAPRPADAEDAFQDACVQFLRYYDGPPSEAILWMQVVVKRCAWAIGRRASRLRETGFELPDANAGSREVEVSRVDPGLGPEEAFERSHDVSERAALLDQLKPDERRALLLLAMGYSYKEIAAGCGWTYTKVNRCVAEGRAALRRKRLRKEPDP